MFRKILKLGGKFMSIKSTIDISYKNMDLAKENPVSVLKSLLKAGWDFKTKDGISYIPLSDSDEFNWTSSNINESDLFRIIDTKINRNEIVGVELKYGDSNIGGELLFFSNKKLSLSLSINRVKLESNQMILCTNFNWYLERLIIGLKSEGYIITSIECFEML